MQAGKVLKIGMAFLGICFGLMGALFLFVVAIGEFSMGRNATIGMGVGFLAMALPCFAFLYSRKLAMATGAVVLLAFAGGMLVLAFPGDSPPVSDATIHQVAAIALFVLLVARIGLALRVKR